MGRNVRGPGDLDLNDPNELKRNILRQLPEDVRRDARQRMGGNPTDSEIEEFVDNAEEWMAEEGFLGGYSQFHEFAEYDDHDLENHYDDLYDDVY